MLLVTIIIIYWVSETIYLRTKYLKNYVINKLLILRIVGVIALQVIVVEKVYCWGC